MRTPLHIVTAFLALLAVLASSTIVAHAACDGDCPGLMKTSCCPEDEAEEKEPSTDTEITGASADCCTQGAVYEQSVAVLADCGCDVTGVESISLQAAVALPEMFVATAAQTRLRPMHESMHVPRLETTTIVLQR